MPVDSESTENPAEWRHQTQADAAVKKWLSEAEPLPDRKVSSSCREQIDTRVIHLLKWLNSDEKQDEGW